MKDGCTKNIYTHNHTHTHIYIYTLRMRVGGPNTNLAERQLMCIIVEYTMMACKVEILSYPKRKSHKYEEPFFIKEKQQIWLGAMSTG